MARSIRVLYRGVQGTVGRNFNWQGKINLDSAVMITAAQFQFNAFTLGSRTLGRPHLGAANIYVTNVGPHGVQGDDPGSGEFGGVEFLLHVDSDSPLDVVVTITALESTEAFQV